MTNSTTSTTNKNTSKPDEVSKEESIERKTNAQLGALEEDDEFEEFEAEG
jgi:hypothetical protein